MLFQLAYPLFDQYSFSLTQTQGQRISSKIKASSVFENIYEMQYRSVAVFSIRGRVARNHQLESGAGEEHHSLSINPDDKNKFKLRKTIPMI